MKKQINEIKKMQRLAGLITESEYQESLLNENNNYDILKAAWETMLNDPSINSKELAINGFKNRLEYKFNSLEEKEYITQLAKSQGLDLSGSEGNKLYFSLPGTEQPTSNIAGGSEVPLTPKVRRYIDKVVTDAKADGEFENLVKYGFFDTELIDNIIEDIFPDNDYDSASKEVMDYIAKVTS